MATPNEIICPDWVEVEIEWSAFGVGASVFVPCINATVLRRQVSRIASSRGYSMVFAVRIENQLLGVRIWRTA